MDKKDINNLIKIYEEKGSKELVNYLYELRKKEELRDLRDYLVSYMHETNEKNNSLYYNGENEQIVTNNTSSIIYFNKKLFSFKNINDRKIVIKESFEVDKDELQPLLTNLKTLYGAQGYKIKDIKLDNKIVEFSSYGSFEKFNYEECELIRKLLINPSFKMSLENAVLYAKGLNGYAYIIGQDHKEKFKQLVK